MIYQLAKTSPLITGQVKMNMIMSGNKVVDLQYVPLSNYIPFAYNTPVDVLNYTHGENVKSLYNKISGQFFKDVQNPKLNQKQLHRYDTLRDETRDFSYEMGMKRMEYQRYNKQFEFFCPFWCNDTTDFDKLKFVINIKNVLPNNPEKERIVFSKVIEFDEKVKQYLKNIYPSLGIYGENSDIVYINFNEMQSHIKGLNVSNGNIQTIDTSYIVNNLLMQERPLLETDNMIISLFGSNKIISTQFFNFSFVFNVEDFLPINFIKSFISERINIYIDMYLEDKLVENDINNISDENNIEKIITKKVDVKDIYSNYEFIPKYDIYNGKYYTEKEGYNVLDYLKDNTCVELINKNKLTQCTFHWALQNNQTSIFNLYNGFSPLYKGKELSTAISNDAPDMFVDIFDINKNPYGVFKYTNFYSNDTTINSVIKLIEDENIYYTIDFNDGKIENEYQFFGNILINNLNLKKIEHENINKIKTAIIRLNESFTKPKLENVLKGFNFNIVNVKINENTNSNTLIIHTNNVKESNNEFTFIFVIYSKDESNTKLTSFSGVYNFYYNAEKYTNEDEKKAYKGLGLIANIVRCSKLPNCICFDKSFSTKHMNSPSIFSKENEMIKTDKFSEIYRYDSNIIPMFIDLNDSVFSNNIYFCKQYNRDILNTIKSIDAGIPDIDGIKTYSKYALTKFTPLYKSLGYYVLNSKKIYYEKYYRDVMFNVHNTQEDGKENFYKDGCTCYCKDVSWYKNNAMIYLPTDFEVSIIKDTGDYINDEDIIKCIFDKVINETEGIYISEDDKKYGYDLVKYYIKDLYAYKYKYDYVDEYIKQQKYEIKFTLK